MLLIDALRRASLSLGAGPQALEAAVAAATDGQTVDLLTDATVASAIQVTGKAVTITGAHTVTTGVTDVIEAGAGGIITLGTGFTLNATSSGLYAHNGGIININGASVTGTGTDYAFAYATDANSQINVIGGSLAKNGSDHVTLSVDNGASATISGGTVSNDTSTAIVAKANGTITVNGGMVKTTANMVAGYVVTGGKITVENGTVESGNWCALSAIRFGQASSGEIIVNGGTINKAVGAYEGGPRELVDVDGLGHVALDMLAHTHDGHAQHGRGQACGEEHVDEDGKAGIAGQADDERYPALHVVQPHGHLLGLAGRGLAVAGKP